MKLLNPLFAALLLVASGYSAEMPPEVAAAKARYQSAPAAGKNLACEQYLQELQKLKSSAKTRKNRGLAAAADVEIKALNDEAATRKSAKDSELPYGKVVPGKPGFVTSPYEPYKGYVDATGLSAGSKIICPYSQKPFLVPEINK